MYLIFIEANRNKQKIKFTDHMHTGVVVVLVCSKCKSTASLASIDADL